MFGIDVGPLISFFKPGHGVKLSKARLRKPGARTKKILKQRARNRFRYREGGGWVKDKRGNLVRTGGERFYANRHSHYANFRGY